MADQRFFELPRSQMYNLASEIADDLESIATDLSRLGDLAAQDGNLEVKRAAEQMHRETVARVESLRELVPEGWWRE